MSKTNVEEWKAAKKTVTMTNEQWSTISCYILMTTQYRKGEREAWASLAKEFKPDGTPEFPNAADNARYYADLEEKLKEIRKLIEEVKL